MSLLKAILKENKDVEDAPFDGAHEAPETHKDRFGNTIKKKNMAKHLAKKGMADAKKPVKEGYFSQSVDKVAKDWNERRRTGKWPDETGEKNPLSHDKDGVYVGDKDLAGRQIITYINDEGKKVTGRVAKRSTNSPKGYFLDTGEFVSQQRVIVKESLNEWSEAEKDTMALLNTWVESYIGGDRQAGAKFEDYVDHYYKGTNSEELLANLANMNDSERYDFLRRFVRQPAMESLSFKEFLIK